MNDAVLPVAAIRAAEQALFDAGTDPYALMERAAAGAADWIWRFGGPRETLVLCGPGNNGGDGFVIARLLRARGVPVRVAALGESRTDSNHRARADWNGPVERFGEAAPAPQVVDALFGIGVTRGLDPEVAEQLAALAVGAQLVSIDVPSGVDSDSGALLSQVPRHDLCIALGAWKPAHLLAPAGLLAARSVCVDIGLDLADAQWRRVERPRLAPPERDSHKYKRGLVAVVAGAMPGAAALAADAAAHGGAGYVRLAGDGPPGGLPHAVVRAGAFEDDPRIAALLIGPGLGRSADAVALLARLLPAQPDQERGLVVDADGLLALRDIGFDLLPPNAILTPHDGEFTALFGTRTGSKIDRTAAAARASGAVVVHKGPDTVIAAPDGRARIASGQTSWLSTAGTGDVLAGLCAARLAVTRDPFAAACEAVWLHGEAARRAGAAFVADDLVPRIPAAIAACL
jgi:hydroxyethylthiazole kinase-like uncharacterized protein yjeF